MKRNTRFGVGAWAGVVGNLAVSSVIMGVGDGEVGRPLPGSPWQGPPVTRNAEIDPGDNDPPPKMTQGVMTPLTPLHHLQQHPRAGSQGVGIATLIFAIFFAIFLRPTEQICPFPRDLSVVSILLALLNFV